MEKPSTEKVIFNCPKCLKKDKTFVLEQKQKSGSKYLLIWECPNCKAVFKDKENEPFIRKYYPKKSVVVSERDTVIEGFLERVGWANYEQIQIWLEFHNYTVSVPVLRTRLSFLTKFGRLRSSRAADSTYFALTKESKRNAELVGVLRHDKLPHENYLIEMFLRYYRKYKFLLPREIRAQTKVGVKSGPIPDLVILDNDGDDVIHIEYERTAKSNHDIDQSIKNWILSPRRSRHDNYIAVLVICETDLIYNKYIKLIEPYKNNLLKNYKSLAWLKVFENSISTEMKIYIVNKIPTDEEYLDLGEVANTLYKFKQEKAPYKEEKPKDDEDDE